jgi:hypothetical protein
MILLPAQSSVSEFCHDLLIAEKLARLGARPPVLRSLCQIGRKVAIRLYKDAHQGASRQGQLPYDPYWIVRSAINDIHASIFFGILHDISRLLNRQGLDPKIFLTAYELYCQVVKKSAETSHLSESGFKSKKLEINRAWHLIQQFNTHEIKLVVCEKCQSRYLALNTVPKAFQLCPICDVWAHVDGRRRWASVKSGKIPRHRDGN